MHVVHPNHVFALEIAAFWFVYLPVAFLGHQPAVVSVATYLAAVGSALSVGLWALRLPPGSPWLASTLVRHIRRAGPPGAPARAAALAAGLVALVTMSEI